MATAALHLLLNIARMVLTSELMITIDNNLQASIEKVHWHGVSQQITKETIVSLLFSAERLASLLSHAVHCPQLCN